MAHKRPGKPVIAVVVLALLGTAGWWWWQSQPQQSSAALAATGSVEATQYQVAPAMAGRITEVSVAEGDTVTKDQVVVTLDSRALALQLSQAKQGVKAAEAAVKNAKDDGTKADVAAARARLSQAESAVKLARVQLGYAQIKAPSAGTVITVIGNVGQNAAPGRTLITLSDTSDLFVRVFVPETRIGNVKIGQQASVAGDSGGTAEGTVTFISSTAEFTPNNVETKEQRTKLVYEVRVTIADRNGALKAGMPVDVTFR